MTQRERTGRRATGLRGVGRRERRREGREAARRMEASLRALWGPWGPLHHAWEQTHTSSPNAHVCLHKHTPTGTLVAIHMLAHIHVFAKPIYHTSMCLHTHTPSTNAHIHGAMYTHTHMHILLDAQCPTASMQPHI